MLLQLDFIICIHHIHPVYLLLNYGQRLVKSWLFHVGLDSWVITQSENNYFLW